MERLTLLNSLYFISFSVRNLDSEFLWKTGYGLCRQKRGNTNLFYGHDDFNRIQAVKSEVLRKGSRIRNLENV